MMHPAFPRMKSCHVAYGLLMLWALTVSLSTHAVTTTDYASRFAAAQSLAKQGDDAGASKIYRELIKLDPHQPEAYNNLAVIKARRGEFKEAQALLEQAMRSHPSYATVYDNLSTIYVEMARDSYGKALRLDAPQQPIALRELTEPTANKAIVASAAVSPKKTPAPETKTVVAVVAPPAKQEEMVAAKTPVVAVTPPAKQEEAVAAKAPVAAVTPPASNVSQQPAPAKTEATATPAIPFDKEAVITALQGWAAAWSEKAVDLYLVFYADTYAPDGLQRRDWEAQRRQRIQAPKWIQVELSDFQVDTVKEDEARVRLIQQYRADNYQDRTRKEFRLRHTPDGWRIVEESTLAMLN